MKRASFNGFFNGFIEAANDVFQLNESGEIIGDALTRHKRPLERGSVDRQIAADETEGRDNLRGFLGGEIDFKGCHRAISFRVPSNIVYNL